MTPASRQRLLVLTREILDILEQPERPEPHGLHTLKCAVWRLQSGACDCGGVEPPPGGRFV